MVGGLLAGLLVAEPDFDDFTPYQPKGTLMSDADTRAWWTTSIIDMAPGHIAFRGENVEDLIGNLGFAEMIWFMVVGTKPSAVQGALLEAALVAGVDHGPQAPSIAAARMAATCGVGLNNAMATGVNMLGDVHGGAGEQCAELYYDIAERMDAGASLDEATVAGLDAWRAQHGKIVSGFGHRFHKPIDPRAPRLMGLVRAGAESGEVSGRFADIGEAVQARLTQERDGRAACVTTPSTPLAHALPRQGTHARVSGRRHERQPEVVAADVGAGHESRAAPRRAATTGRERRCVE